MCVDGGWYGIAYCYGYIKDMHVLSCSASICTEHMLVVMVEINH